MAWYSSMPPLLGLLVLSICLKCCWCQSTPPSCSKTAPSTCTFADTFCDWVANGWFLDVNHTSAKTPNHSATLLSPLACRKDPFCLRFEFYAFDIVPDSNLDVVLQANNTEKGLWRVLASNTMRTFTTGTVSVIPRSDFRVAFRAQWKAGRSPVISLKTVKYDPNPCEMSPTGAFVPPGSKTKTTPTPPVTTDKGTSGAEGCISQFMTLRSILLTMMSVSLYSLVFM